MSFARILYTLYAESNIYECNSFIKGHCTGHDKLKRPCFHIRLLIGVPGYGRLKSLYVYLASKSNGKR